MAHLHLLLFDKAEDLKWSEATEKLPCVHPRLLALQMLNFFTVVGVIIQLT